LTIMAGGVDWLRCQMSTEHSAAVGLTT
jgi:hypothetical protein